jgi:hypothetical protein
MAVVVGRIRIDGYSIHLSPYRYEHIPSRAIPGLATSDVRLLREGLAEVKQAILSLIPHDVFLG